MSRVPQLTADPTRDAASLLRRMGFVVLMGAFPLAALVSRSGPVVVATVGIVLIALAAFFDGGVKAARDTIAGLSSSAALAALLVLAAWAAVSLAWTPAVKPAALRLGAVLFFLGGSAIAILSLPDRMRSANLYPIPIGTAGAALAALAMIAVFGLGADPDDARRIEVALTVVVSCAWPAIAWLRSRGRDIEASLIALVVAVAASIAPSLAPTIAFAIGAVVYLVVQAFGRPGALLVATILAALLVLAPALLVYGLPALAGVPALKGWVADLDYWRAAIMSDPLRLLTGHGSGSLRRGVEGPFSLRVAGTTALALWFELGLVGVLAGAAMIVAIVRQAAHRYGQRAPAIVAAVATGYSLTLSGIDGGESWWPLTLLVVTILFVAIERGQFRTRRPRLFGLARHA